MNQFHASNTSDTDDWLPTTLLVDSQHVSGLVRTARGRAAVIAELDAVFLTAECNENDLDDLQLVEVTAQIDTYVAGRAALSAAKSEHSL